MKNQYSFVIIFIALTFLATSCWPPRCKIPRCGIVMDHLHAKHGKGGKAPRKPAKEAVLYRGIPWYYYLFYKRHKPDPNKTSTPIKGKYRKIDTRDAYKKRPNKINK